ncbi:MAG: hypothetical protein EXR66_05045 [Dehalococcoidia bacterium]|nr:hypothetical protein [Dehalococcoidia bacterium]
MNNYLLVWLAWIQFTTALVGDYLDEPVAVSIYAANLGLAAAVLAFVWLPRALLLIAGIPLAYFVPNLLTADAEG